jgi:hypothetical protein
VVGPSAGRAWDGGDDHTNPHPCAPNKRPGINALHTQTTTHSIRTCRRWGVTNLFWGPPGSPRSPLHRDPPPVPRRGPPPPWGRTKSLHPAPSHSPSLTNKGCHTSSPPPGAPGSRQPPPPPQGSRQATGPEVHRAIDPGPPLGPRRLRGPYVLPSKMHTHAIGRQCMYGMLCEPNRQSTGVVCVGGGGKWSSRVEYARGVG